MKNAFRFELHDDIDGGFFRRDVTSYTFKLHWLRVKFQAFANCGNSRKYFIGDLCLDFEVKIFISRRVLQLVHQKSLKPSIFSAMARETSNQTRNF